MPDSHAGKGCFQWIKDTNLKANHNNKERDGGQGKAVSNGSKILIWKQITTDLIYFSSRYRCFQWIKDTNLKANHNCSALRQHSYYAVSNGSKILIWKQITTYRNIYRFLYRCFQWIKDTNLKANHNGLHPTWQKTDAVSNGSKILIWKQITTPCFA